MHATLGRGFQKASIESDFNWMFSRTLNQLVRDVESEEIFLRRTVYFYQNGKSKADSKWHGPGIVIGRFGRKGDLLCSWGNSIVVDLNDLTFANKISDVAGRYGKLHLHSTDAKSAIRYLVEPQSLVS